MLASRLGPLWLYLWRQHGEEEGREAVRPPSYRQLGQRLNIPRERLPGLFALLRRLVTRERSGQANARRGIREAFGHLIYAHHGPEAECPIIGFAWYHWPK